MPYFGPVGTREQVSPQRQQTAGHQAARHRAKKYFRQSLDSLRENQYDKTKSKKPNIAQFGANTKTDEN
jgi:hypothetical protein